MTPRDLTFEALDHIGVATITLAGTRKLARIAHDLTDALQEISTDAPGTYQTRRGQRLAAMETVSVTATEGSGDISFSGTFVDGSTIRIDGDDAWNEVRLEVAQKKLLIPFNGSTGVHSATLYHDVAPLGTDEAEILGRPLLEGYGFLTKSVNRIDLIQYPHEPADYGRRTRAINGMQRVTGRPTHFWVESGYNSVHGGLDRIRLYPTPTGITQLSYDVRLLARTVTVTDLGSDASDSTFVLPIQEDYHESLLRPIFLEKWSGSAWFRLEEQKRTIEKNAARARLLLQKFNPQRARNRRLRAPL